MKIELYYAPTTCALVPYVTLTEAGADFQVHRMNFRKKDQMSPDYLKINPKHKVPSLVVDGKVLTETVAINSWVAHTFPAARLLPEEPWQKFQAISLLSWCSGGIHPHLARLNGPPKFGGVGPGEATVRKAAEEMTVECLAVADDMLKGREFFFDHFTAPDAHFYWCCRRAKQMKIDMSSFMACNAHFDRVEARPSVQKVLAFEKDVLATFAAAA